MPKKSAASPEALSELIEISRQVGADPDLVQGGGGNTSVKSRDGKFLYVKASGTSLAEMDETRGWAEMDLDETRSLLEVSSLEKLSESRREGEVLRRLQAAVLRPSGARPSVESSLHAILERVVVHTHPVGLNVLLCSKQSRQRYLDAVRDIASEPLYVPYVDPGYTLAARLDGEIKRYTDRHGAVPAVVLLENHGLFVSTPEVRQCLRLSKRLTDRGMEWIGEKRINPLRFREIERTQTAMDPRVQGAMVLRGALLAAGGPAVLVRHDRSRMAAEFLGNPAAVRAARRGAFTPDQIVYCRTFPLFLPARHRSVPAWSSAWQRQVRAYTERHGQEPRVAIEPGGGVYYAGGGLSQLRVVGEVYRSAMTAMLRTGPAGGARFLTRRQAGFIEGWEVEHFRSALHAGASTPLKGRVGVVIGAASASGRSAVTALVAAGSLVIGLDSDVRGLESLAAAFSSARFLTLPGDPAREDACRRAFLRVASSVGGLDALVLAGGRGVPALKDLDARTWKRSFDKEWTPVVFALREALRIFDLQGSGGAVVEVAKGESRQGHVSAGSLTAAWSGELEAAGVRSARHSIRTGRRGDNAAFVERVRELISPSEGVS